MLTAMGVLRLSNRAAWEKRVREAMVKAHGSVPEAAGLLGISRRQLERWLGEKMFLGLPRTIKGPVPGSRRTEPIRCRVCGGKGHNSRTCKEKEHADK